MNATFSFTVSKKQENTPLLACLYPAIPYLQPEQWQRLLAGHKGDIQVDGITVHEDVILLLGQVVSYTLYDYQEAEVDCTWSVIWSNHEIAAIHKPANLPVNRTTRNVYNTLIQLLRRESPWPKAHLLHRLDLETSGVILIAQNNAVARRYQAKLSGLIKRKIYHAIVIGKPAWQEQEFRCDLSMLAEGQGGTPIRSQMHVVAAGSGKESQSRFRCLSSIEKEGAYYSLLECEIFTGRKHQIRAQLAHLGHPIVGDKIYNNQGTFYLKRLAKTLTAEDHEALLSSHHLLHAYEVHLHNLWLDENEETQEIIIRDEAFPESWQHFGF